eukprot:4537515-Amphidinium_carterae.1
MPKPTNEAFARAATTRNRELRGEARLGSLQARLVYSLTRRQTLMPVESATWSVIDNIEDGDAGPRWHRACRSIQWLRGL